MATFKNLKVGTTLAGDLKAIEKADLDLDIAAASAAVQGVTLSDLAVKLKKTGQKIAVTSASVKSGKGSITGSGSVTLGAKPGEDGTLDLAAKIAGAVKASSPKVTLSGMAATDVALGLSGNTKEMKIEEFSSKFGGGTLGATGNVKLGAAPDVTVDISGKDLDLAALTAGMPDAKELRIGGRVNASFKGRFAGASGKGEGSITSQSLTVMGLKATALNYPLVLEGNTLSGKGAAASFYGGKVSGSGTLDMATMKFSHSAELSGVDVNAVLQDFTCPGLGQCLRDPGPQVRPVGQGERKDRRRSGFRLQRPGYRDEASRRQRHQVYGGHRSLPSRDGAYHSRKGNEGDGAPERPPLQVPYG
jgi:hypothetical protein